MMPGHEKSDLVIVAMKPANKAKKAPCGGVCGSGRSGVGGAKGGGQGECAPAKHVLDSEPGSRVKGAGAYTATCAVTHPRQEPYAGKPHVRIWAGACDETHVPTATTQRIHHAARWRGSDTAACGGGAARSMRLGAWMQVSSFETPAARAPRGRGLRTCPWARLVIRVFGVRLHSPVGGARGDQQEAGTSAQRHGRGRQTAA